jgi:hypothetical protein
MAQPIAAEGGATWELTFIFCRLEGFFAWPVGGIVMLHKPIAFAFSFAKGLCNT